MAGQDPICHHALRGSQFPYHSPKPPPISVHGNSCSWETDPRPVGGCWSCYSYCCHRSQNPQLARAAKSNWPGLVFHFFNAMGKKIHLCRGHQFYSWSLKVTYCATWSEGLSLWLFVSALMDASFCTPNFFSPHLHPTEEQL